MRFFEKSKTHIADIALGERHSVFLSREGELYTCGYGGKKGMLSAFFGESAGALGHGDSLHRAMPKKVGYFAKNGIKIKQIAAGRYHSVALSEEGDIYTWGRGAYGTLGTGKKSPSNTPAIIEDVKSYRKEDPNNEVIRIDAADYFTAALTSTRLLEQCL